MILLLIFLIFLVYIMLTNDNSKTNGWSINGVPPIIYIYIGDDDTLYAFMGHNGNTIYSIDCNGKIKWNMTIPDHWCVYNTFNRPSSMYLNYTGDYSIHSKKVVCASNDGILYLYIRENKTTYFNHDFYSYNYVPLYNNSSNVEERVIAISSHGKILWNMSISHEYHPFDDINIIAKNDRIYVFDDYNETVLSNRGDILFKIQNISDPASIDENGNIYVVMSKNPEILPFFNGTLYDYKEPSNIISAYNQNGTLIWQKNISTLIYREESLRSMPLQTNLPLYQNNTLYLSVKDGVVALNLDGSVKWLKNFSGGYFRLFDLMPIDSNDNVYVRCYDFNPNVNYSYIIALAPNGSIISRTLANSDGCYQGRACANGGVLYLSSYIPPEDGENFTALPSYMITAYDMIKGVTLWEYMIHPEDKFTTTISKSNIYDLMSPELADYVISFNCQANSCHHNYTCYTQSDGYSYILHDNNITYFGYYVTKFGWPSILNKTKCVYSGDIYAINSNGSLLWKKSAAYLVTSMAGNDGSFYYGGRNGMLYEEWIGQAAGGIALAGTIYVIFRFFLAGIFSRAKDRLSKNENRNRILEYIETHPGLTLYELSRGVGMNVGTVRYHLFILSLNHLILSHNTFGKYSRYFVNSTNNSEEKQYIISLIRHDTIRKLLNLLLIKPGLSNSELAEELDMQKSTISAYMKKLLEKGIVVKSAPRSGKAVYFISQNYRERIAYAIELINNETVSGGTYHDSK